jgi:carbon monoxide dehydrogenase subunit G
MGIPIEKSFVVAAPAAAVWDFLTDPAKVASCLPGAAITGKEDDSTWVGTMTVKVGPVTASYRGKLRFERLDAAAREAEIAASGQETRGKGGADMRMKSRVVERGPSESEVTVASDVNVVGVLAQFGRGMIQDVSDQLFRKFTEAMRRQLEEGEAPAAPRAVGEATVAAKTVAAAPATSAAPPPPPPPPAAENVLDVGALGTTALGRAAMRTLRRPAFWIGVAVLVLIVYWLARG